MKPNTWSKISGSPRAGPDVLVYQTAPLEADLTWLGRSEVRTLRFHDGDRFRLGRQADRRLSQRVFRIPRQQPSRPPGRLPATRPRRRDARQVPQQLRPRAVRAQPADPGELHASRTSATPSVRAIAIMVQVQSTWFPLIDRNPQTFVDIYNGQGIRLPEGDPADLPFAQDGHAGDDPRDPLRESHGNVGRHCSPYGPPAARPRSPHSP